MMYALFNINKYDGEFVLNTLNFRRVLGSYNQNWRWDE